MKSSLSVALSEDWADYPIKAPLLGLRRFPAGWAGTLMFNGRREQL